LDVHFSPPPVVGHHTTLGQVGGDLHGFRKPTPPHRSPTPPPPSGVAQDSGVLDVVPAFRPEPLFPYFLMDSGDSFEVVP